MNKLIEYIHIFLFVYNFLLLLLTTIVFCIILPMDISYYDPQYEEIFVNNKILSTIRFIIMKFYFFGTEFMDHLAIFGWLYFTFIRRILLGEWVFFPLRI
jgi:hypothetical protein